MKSSCIRTPLVVLVVIGTMALSPVLIGQAHKSAAQDSEKSLDIGRYPNEPFELVDLKVRQNSVTDAIRFKSRDNRSQWGFDNVKFKEGDDWLQHVAIRLRNVSGRPIYGLTVSLYFRHPSLRMLFQTFLRQTQTADLKRQPLQSGDEIDLVVSEASLINAVKTMRERGIDPIESSVSLSVDSAIFSDDLHWSRGSFMRKDPNQPKRWFAVDKTAAGMPQFRN
jgi:hypothetical protein